MFTGLVQAVGRVAGATPRRAGGPTGSAGSSGSAGAVRLEIDPGSWRHQPRRGDSISVSGCCLTLVGSRRAGGGNRRLWAFDVVPETLAKTSLGGLKPGDRVNLEHALRADGLMGGHLVQGHVDGVGRVAGVRRTDGWRVAIAVPKETGACMIPKGSVTIEGVSLTIASVRAARGATVIDVALIPETLARTTLAELRTGARVNVEADMIAKTVVNLLAHHPAAGRLARATRASRRRARA